MSRHLRQGRLQTLCTRIIQSPSDRGDNGPDFGVIGGASFPVSGRALEVCAHKPDQAFPVQAGICLHLVQKMVAFLAIGLVVSLLHPAQVLILLRPSDPPVTLSFERTGNPG